MGVEILERNVGIRVIGNPGSAATFAAKMRSAAERAGRKTVATGPLVDSPAISASAKTHR